MPRHGSERKHRLAAGADLAGSWELLQLLRDGRARTRSQLAVELDLSRSTVTSRIQALTIAGLIRPVGGEHSSGGRPASTLAFNTAALLILAVHITPASTQAALMDLGGKCHAHHDAPNDPGQSSPSHTLAAVITWAQTTLVRIGRKPADLGGVGVSLPMDIDQDSGRPLGTAAMPGWAGFDVNRFIAKSLTVPVKVENDIHLLALNERLSRWAEHSDLLYVHAAKCPKAAIISGGQLQRGFSGTAGTLGWAQDAATSGPPSQNPPASSVEPSAGDTAVAREEGRRLGEVLAIAVNILNPSALLVGGRNVHDAGHFIAGLRETVLHRSPPAATLGHRSRGRERPRRAGWNRPRAHPRNPHSRDTGDDALPANGLNRRHKTSVRRPGVGIFVTVPSPPRGWVAQRSGPQRRPKRTTL
ncbi:ROK family transcriptional regulator [Paenarthrobacter sp. TYUT067]|uniref:ROK family transcriptional regulator n=1 Tax=Paenarthrobacter sp. TYUT067 TaxID=2926245 RepID=UPI00202FAF14|nr:ROK family transcriptional regulator [Paenarthrobacter sp. TYUT067]MCM0614985.1 ROK family transcriptional regulator [Paenarthrobacter sp. TYUT067]